MAAASSFLPQQSGWDHPSALAVGDSPTALWRSQRTFQAAERAQAGAMIDVALDRLTRGRWDAVWIEIDGDFDGRVERLLQQVNEDVGAGRYRAVVSAVPELIDPVSAIIACPDVELIINAGDAERAAALAMLSRPATAGVRDSASDLSGPRLRQLSDEVTRIAATLAKLSTGIAPPAIAEAAIHASPAGAPAVPAEAVRGVIRARRLRADHLPADLFADPAWDMLLDLLQAEIVQHRVPVSSLCNAAAVPATTALRWLKTMTERGVVQRRNDPHDGRRVFIELAKGTSNALRNYFAEAGRLGVI
jgi:DNA-binding MarR family transcriptional regulator